MRNSKKKYNIALLPVNRHNDIIQYAQLFTTISDQYLLGNQSLPHLTLCQFLAEPHEAIQIWKQACVSLDKKTINLYFKEISCISFDNEVFWVSLLPTKTDDLIKMHFEVAQIVKFPINKSFQKYNPHITLMNTKKHDCSSYVKKLSEIFIPFEDSFVISMGKSDEIGQFLEVINLYQPEENIKLINKL